MSPTLLEGVIVLLLIITAWQIGIQVAPGLLRGVRHANDELTRSSEEVIKAMKGKDSE